MYCDKPQADWDPRSPDVLDDQIAAYDDMRRRCPIAHSDYLGWSLFRHADVVRVLNDHDTFSNQVSRHVSVPNGMDPPLHTAFRALIEPYLSAAHVQAFEPACRAIAGQLVGALPRNGEADIMEALARPYAVITQGTYMGWPESVHQPLLDWVHRQQAATLAGDRAALAACAYAFDDGIRALLEARRSSGDAVPDDLTTQLMNETVDGRPITDEEVISILRNWTVGELGTMAASVGIVVQFLAERQDVQDMLRADPSRLVAAIDEILRIHAPLIANRRTVTQPVDIGGQALRQGDRLTILWASANRDEAVFGDPDEFRLDRDPALNLLYGAGIHVCPGAALARLELRVLIEVLLAREARIYPVEEGARQACYPASGYTMLPVRFG
ncbi:cytochrome P450 [Pusillimonas sp. TS35]|nr:cytochrome P450 [Pusillimonas sp. TS35]